MGFWSLNGRTGLQDKGTSVIPRVPVSRSHEAGRSPTQKALIPRLRTPAYDQRHDAPPTNHIPSADRLGPVRSADSSLVARETGLATHYQPASASRREEEGWDKSVPHRLAATGRPAGSAGATHGGRLARGGEWVVERSGWEGNGMAGAWLWLAGWLAGWWWRGMFLSRGSSTCPCVSA